MLERPACGLPANPSTGGSGRPAAVNGRCFSTAPPSRRLPMSAGCWATVLKEKRPAAPTPTAPPIPQ
eukprot:8494279-Alexandrium_andersonii.AAC.1